MEHRSTYDADQQPSVPESERRQLARLLRGYLRRTGQQGHVQLVTVAQLLDELEAGAGA